jgi:hypothetical protein
MPPIRDMVYQQYDHMHEILGNKDVAKHSGSFYKEATR